MSHLTHLCPCGCEEELAIRANGRRPLMCTEAWNAMPRHLKSQFVDGSYSPEIRRAAVRKLLGKAASMKKERLAAQQLELKLQ